MVTGVLREGELMLLVKCYVKETKCITKRLVMCVCVFIN